MFDGLKKRLWKARRLISFLLAMVMAITGFQFPVWADSYDNYLDGWKVACAWSTLSNDYTWDAENTGMKQPKLVVTYRLENAEHDYAPGDIQFDIPGIGNANRASILKASDLASDEEDSEWNCVWDQEADIYTFSNKFSVESGQSVSGGFQLLWTLQARSLQDSYNQSASPVFRVNGAGQIAMEPLSFAFTSVRDRYRISINKDKLAAADYEEADQGYIWYEFETRFDKDWLARGLYRSSYYIAVDLPEGKDYTDVVVKSNGDTFSLEEITTESGDTVWGFYPFKNRSGDIGSQYSTYYNRFQLGFLKEHFSDDEAEEYRNVIVRGHLDRLYQDESEWVTEAGENECVDDEVSFTVEDYSFTYSGYIYSHSKWNSSYEDYPYNHNAPDYSERLNAVNIYNGKVVQFILSGTANRNYTSSTRMRSRIVLASPSNILKQDSEALTSSTSKASSSNAQKAAEDIPIPDIITDWNDIHWREHELHVSDEETNGIRYGEIHPELASDSNASYDPSDPDSEPFVPDVTIIGALSSAIKRIGKAFAPIQAFAADTASKSNATNSATTFSASNPTLPGGNTSGSSQIGVNGNADQYSLVIGDDKLAIFLTDGSIRNLEDEEYDIAYVTIPADSKKYDYEVYGAPTQDMHFDDYTYYGSGNTATQNTIQLPSGTKAVFVRVNNITGSYSYNVYVGVRLHLDWEAEQEKAFNGEPTPDHENHLVNFSYLRALYINNEGYEVNDCALETDNYTGTYGKELAERDMEVYEECMLRGYSNVWLRSPITALSSGTSLSVFSGSNIGGFTASVTSRGTIKADDSGPLEKFSLYMVVPDGLSLDLDTSGIKLTGSGTYLSGDAASDIDFENHVSYSVGTYSGKTMLVADFDFSNSPLEISETTSIAMTATVNLKYTDYISFGNYYSVNSYLMVHDDGLDKISGLAIMTDSYDIDGNGITTEKMAYSGDSETVLDSATEWREYVSKYVASAYSDGYETETVTRLYYDADNSELKEKSLYSYRLEFGLGSDNAKNIDFFDRIEQGAKIALNEAEPDNYTDIPSAWQGTFLSIDTSYAEKMKLVPTVYYSTDADQELAVDAEGWSTEIPEDPADVKSIWVHLDTSNLEDGLMKTRQMTYITINMQAPSDRTLVEQKAVNQYYVQFDAYGISSADDFEARYELPSAETYVRLLDTVGKITLQKVDADNITGTSDDGSVKYAALTGAKFQVYDSDGTPMFEEGGKEVNALGQITISNVPYGTYYWEEIEAPSGYQKIEGCHPFEIDGVTEILNIENHRIPGEVELTKRDQDDTDVAPLAGAEFELYKENGDQVFFDEGGAYSESGNISRLVTDVTGKLRVTNLPWGDYQFVETKAPDGYELNTAPISFTIGRNQFNTEGDDAGKVIAKVDAYNKESPASILLIKKDSSDGKPVKDAVFSLYRKAKGSEEEDKLIQSGLKTNVAGELQVDNLLYGEYYFVETRNPMGYLMPSESDAVTESVVLDRTTTNQILEVNHTNDRMQGEVVLTKFDDAGQLVEGAEYALMYQETLDEDYVEVGNGYTTNTEGEIKVTDLDWGNYYFIETKAPMGYVLSDEKITFTLDVSTVQSTVYVEATDQRQKGSFKLIKVDADDPSITLAGAVYDLYRTDGTKCVSGIDYTLPEGVDQIVTGADGTITITDIPQGGYYLLEVTAPESYSLSDEKIRFSITKENASVLQEITAEDVRNKASLKINKSVNEVYSPFGNPTFIFRINQVDPGGEEVIRTYYKTITLTPEQLDGSVSFTVDQGYEYLISEMEVARYQLTDIEANTDNVMIEAEIAEADLSSADYAEVTFSNEIEQYEKFSHTTNATNIIKSGAKLTGIRVEYIGPNPINEDTEGYDADERTYTISADELIVTALYDDGSNYVIPEGSYTLTNPVVDGSSNSYTGTVIYSENGSERSGSFSIDVTLPEPWKRYWVIMELDGGTIVRDGDTTMTAVTSWERQVKEGSTVSEPVNDPQKPGFRFGGWYADADCKTAYNFSSKIEEDTHIYAKWIEDYDVKYAVAIYAINDTDADGTVLPLTFGPASGMDYRTTYTSHTPAEGEMCIHDMSWEEIIAQARKDPTVFQTCLETGCTHSVLISMTDEDGNAKAIKGTGYSGKMDNGDGATNLYNSISSSYRKWNREHSTYYTSGTRYDYGTNEGGWPDSAIRNMLNGTVTDNMLNITNKDNGFEEAKLDESTALISCFPDALQAAIYARAIKSDTVYNSKIEENVAVTHDKLWLMSSNEYFANPSSLSSYYQHPLEGESFDRQTYLTVNNNTTMARLYTESGSSTCWLRSVHGYGGYNALCVYSGSCSSNSCFRACGVAPGFSIK